MKRMFFQEHPEYIEQEAINQAKQRRIQQDIEALESGDVGEIIKFLLRKAILG
jgi:hypothetical protein